MDFLRIELDMFVSLVENNKSLSKLQRFHYYIVKGSCCSHDPMLKRIQTKFRMICLKSLQTQS